MDLLIREVAAYLMIEVAICTFAICVVFVICFGFGGDNGKG